MADLGALALGTYDSTNSTVVGIVGTPPVLQEIGSAADGSYVHTDNNNGNTEIAVFDLENTGAVFAVQTADLGRAVPDGFEVLGREAGAEERGCSIAADELLAESIS